MVMGLSWGDIGAFGLPGGPEYNLYKQFKRGNGYTPPGASTTPPLQAGDVSLLPELQSPLEGINTKRQASLADSLGTLQGREATSAAASGRAYGGYAPSQIAAAGGRSSRSIEDALRGSSGAASLEDTKNQRSYDANLKLVNELGAINAPSFFEQLVAGATLAGKSAGEFKGLYDAIGRNDKNKNRYQVQDYEDPYSFGGDDYARYA